MKVLRDFQNRSVTSVIVFVFLVPWFRKVDREIHFGFSSSLLSDSVVDICLSVDFSASEPLKESLAL